MSHTLKTIKHTVMDPNGIHARPAGIIVTTAKKYESQIKLRHGDNSADCKRIFAVMGLSLKQGECFTIDISGEDEGEAAAALEAAIKESGI